MRVVFLTGVLAVVSAAACTSKKQPPVATHSPLADSADQVMYGARFNLTDKGLARAEKIYLDELMKTEDTQEGINAFLQKREPLWKNK